jgi:hypothetical protein
MRTVKDRETGWSREQVREFCKRLKNDVGDGWRFMVPEVREAMVARFAFYIAAGQNSETVGCREMMNLFIDMCGELARRGVELGRDEGGT